MPEALDEHYKDVGKQILAGKVVFFLGAGASLFERGGQFELQKNLPSGVELSEYLATEFDYPGADRGDLARVTQYIEVKLDDGPLRDALHKVFRREPPWPPTSLHRFLGRLPGVLRASPRNLPPSVQHQLLITTNYDGLLEDSFRDENESFDVVWYDPQAKDQIRLCHAAGPNNDTMTAIVDPGKYDALSLAARSIVFKMHGTLHVNDPDRDSFVITEDHYIDYLTRANVDTLVPVLLRERLKKSHFLFLGSSLRDWNVRALLRGIQEGQRFNYRGWAIDQRDDPIEKKFWARRNVDFITSGLQEYVAGLSAHLTTRAASPKDP
jgi:hypothetical protein